MNKVVLHGIDWDVDDEDERKRLPERVEVITEKCSDVDRLIARIEAYKGYRILSCCMSKTSVVGNM